MSVEKRGLVSPVELNAATLGRFKSSHPETVFSYQLGGFKQEISVIRCYPEGGSGAGFCFFFFIKSLFSFPFLVGQGFWAFGWHRCWPAQGANSPRPGPQEPCEF